jgi:hypothetical protein
MIRLQLSVCWSKQIMPELGHEAFLILVAALAALRNPRNLWTFYRQQR